MSDPTMDDLTQPFSRTAKDALEVAVVAINSMQGLIDRLTAQRDDLRRRADDAERRERIAVQRAEEVREQASRTADLDEAGKRLLEALNRLPTKMEDAGVMQMVTPPAIPLYGTHEWQAVTDAKIVFASVLPKEE